MKHLDDKQLDAYLTRRGELADPRNRRLSTAHIVDCPTCSKRLKAAQQRKRATEERKRQSQKIEDTVPTALGATRVATHLSDRQLASYLAQRDETTDPLIRGAMGDHIAQCEDCSNRLVALRKDMRASGELRTYEPELLTPDGLRPAGRLTPGGFHPTARPRQPPPPAPAPPAPSAPVAETAAAAAAPPATDEGRTTVDRVAPTDPSERPTEEVPAPTPPPRKRAPTVERVRARPAPPPAAVPGPPPSEAAPRLAPHRRRRWPLWAAGAAIVPAAAAAGWFAATSLSAPANPAPPGSPVAEPVATAPGGTVTSGTDSASAGSVVPGDSSVPLAAAGRLETAALAATPAEPDRGPVAAPTPASNPAPEPAAPSPVRPAAPAAAPAPTVLVGTVREAGSNRPLAGVTVAIPRTGKAVRTGPDGRFRLSEPPVGDIELVASLTGYVDARASTLVAPGRGGSVTLRLRPEPPAAAAAVAPPAPPPEVDSTVPEPPPAPAPRRPTPVPAPAAAPAAAAPAAAPETDPELIAGTWVRIGQDEAEEALGRSIVVVPDLEIESIAEPGSRDRTGVRIVQLLESGERLELVITSPPFLSRGRGRRGDASRVTAIRVAPPASPGAQATGTARLGAHLITAKANLPADALSALLARLGSP